MTDQKLSYLPEHPADLIDVALADLEAAEAQGIAIDMTTWVQEFNGKPCAVCLAGACMIGTLAATMPDLWMLTDPRLSCEDRGRLNALDHLRLGNIEAFLYFMGNPKFPSSLISLQPAHFFKGYTPHHQNPENFKAWLRKVSDFFRTDPLFQKPHEFTTVQTL